MKKRLTELETEEILDTLHSYLQKTNLVLKKEQRKIADEKMTKVLEDGLIQELLEKRKKDDKARPNVIEEKRVFAEIEFLMLKFYYAIYNDNVDLYRKILDKKISLGDSVYNNKLYLLNSELRNIFKTDKEYFDFISIYHPSIKRFYASLGNKDTKERDEYLDTFTNIIKKDKRYLAKRKDNDQPIYLHLLNARNIRVFGEDFLKNATGKQKDVIETFNYKISDEHLEKIKHLIKKYPNYVIPCKFEDAYMDSFTIDEIAKMPRNQTILYNEAAKVRIMNQLTDVFKLNPDFDCPLRMIREDVFAEIPADTMVMLSNDAKTEIARLKRNDNYKRNINRVVNRDLHNLKDILKKKILKRKEKKKSSKRR